MYSSYSSPFHSSSRLSFILLIFLPRILIFSLLHFLVFYLILFLLFPPFLLILLLNLIALLLPLPLQEKTIIWFFAQFKNVKRA